MNSKKNIEKLIVDLHTAGRLDDKKLEIIRDKSLSLCIEACPGSGKTWTSSLRFLQRANTYTGLSQGVALLTHTHVAIDSFCNKFRKMGTRLPSFPHIISTLDSFIANYILFPFGHLIMKCEVRPYLVPDKSKYFKHYQIREAGKNYGTDISEFAFNLDENNKYILHSQDYDVTLFNIKDFKSELKRMGRTGAYSHEHGRIWAHHLLKNYPKIANTIAYRFPEILVDEAQDTGAISCAIITELEKAGASISLIGDSDQAIYGFSNADGSYLKVHQTKQNVSSHSLMINYRSNVEITEVAKNFSTSKFQNSNFTKIHESHGAFIIGYKTQNNLSTIAKRFEEKISESSLNINNSAIVCRNRTLLNKVQAAQISSKKGQGAIILLVEAAIARDVEKSYPNCLSKLKLGLCQLLDSEEDIKSWEFLNNSIEPLIRQQLNIVLWNFCSNAKEGLPHSTQIAKTTWITQLRTNLTSLIRILNRRFSTNFPDKFGSRITTKDLEEKPIFNSTDDSTLYIRLDTVHQVKGETLDAILYAAKSDQFKSLISSFENGPIDELGRIGYVAVTRAQHLLWVAAPIKDINNSTDKLESIGFKIIK